MTSEQPENNQPMLNSVPSAGSNGVPSAGSNGVPSAGSNGVPSAGALRASDTDREQVAQVLSTAFAEGRLTRDEHDERLNQAMVAKTFADLVPLTRDLVYTGNPTPLTEPIEQPQQLIDTTGASSEPDRMIAVFGGTSRTGRWRVRKNMQAYALFGGQDIDMRDAVFESPTVEISGFWCFGGMDLKVPEGIEVRDQTVGIFGGSDVKNLGDPDPGAPVLVLKGVCLFGGVSVKGTARSNRRWH